MTGDRRRTFPQPDGIMSIHNPPSPEDAAPKPILAALAVLGCANTPAIAATLDQPIADDWADQIRDLREGERAGWFSLPPGEAEQRLADLRRDDAAQYRRLHERAIAFLSGCLRAGDAEVEPAFHTAWTRLADSLLLEDPDGFGHLVASVEDMPLHTPVAQQFRRFYQGLALGLRDRYREAIALFDGLLAEPELDDTVRGRALNTRANYCRYTGQLEQAVTGYRASLALWQRLGNRLREGIALLNLGITHYELRQYAEAESDLSAALACFEDAGAPPWLAAAHNELGLVCRDQGRWRDALDHFRVAESHYQSQAASDPLGRVRNNIGEVLLFQERIDEAAQAFEQALRDMRTRTYAIDAHLNLGLAHQARGDWTAAGVAFRQALDLAREIDRRDVLAQAHYRLGELLRRQGENEDALAQFVAAAQVVETNREPMRDEDLKISLLGRWQQVYEALVLHCVALGRAADAFEWAEKARARAFADAVAGQDSGASLAPSGVATAADVQRQLPARTAMLCYFTTGVLERDVPLLAAIPPGSTLREHLVVPARTLLFLVTREQVQAVTCPLDPNAFATSSLRAEDRARWLTPPVLRKLHETLLAPAGAALDAALHAERVLLLPHGPLHQVAFGALAGASGQAMIREQGPQLVHVPSATVWLHLRDRQPASQAQPASMLAVGYDGADGDLGGATLRHTEAEARHIVAHMGGEAWAGSQPKLAGLREASAGRRWLHFACHGAFDYERPLESYLAVGPGERLTAREVLNDWRIDADLVTLSACRSGVARVLRGDEPMGLARAFLYAGARAVVVSQWPVEDLPAYLLMRRFYAALGQSVDPAEALREAQVWLRDLNRDQVRQQADDWPAADVTWLDPFAAEDRPFAHPRYWAAFIVVGAV